MNKKGKCNQSKQLGLKSEKIQENMKKLCMHEIHARHGKKYIWANMH